MPDSNSNTIAALTAQREGVHEVSPNGSYPIHPSFLWAECCTHGLSLSESLLACGKQSVGAHEGPSTCTAVFSE